MLGSGGIIRSPRSSEMRSLLSADDLSDDDVNAILHRARELRTGRAVPSPGPRRLLSLIFLEPSLRTRVGFIAAAVRLGWQTVDVVERRHSPTSMKESWSDTLRIVAGYSDVILTRPGQPLGREDVAGAACCPVINGGDIGPHAQHPSQSLVDLFAMQELVGPLARIRLAIVGDPRMRAVRSLLAFLARRPPAALALVADDDHAREVHFPVELRSGACFTSWERLRDVDVVYIAGIPHGALPLDRREALLATAARVEALPPRCILLSPMPVIDEMDQDVCRDPRNRIFEQSDLGLFVRIAILEHVVGTLPDRPRVGHQSHDRCR